MAKKLYVGNLSFDATEDELRQVVDRFRGEDCSFLVPPPSIEATLTATTRVDVGHEALLR